MCYKAFSKCGELCTRNWGSAVQLQPETEGLPWTARRTWAPGTEETSWFRWVFTHFRVVNKATHLIGRDDHLGQSDAQFLSSRKNEIRSLRRSKCTRREAPRLFGSTNLLFRFDRVCGNIPLQLSTRSRYDAELEISNNPNSSPN